MLFLASEPKPLAVIRFYKLSRLFLRHYYNILSLHDVYMSRDEYFCDKYINFTQKYLLLEVGGGYETYNYLSCYIPILVKIVPVFLRRCKRTTDANP